MSRRRRRPDHVARTTASMHPVPPSISCAGLQPRYVAARTMGKVELHRQPWPAPKEKRFPPLIFAVVRSRGLEPPRVAPLAPQASASTNSATTAVEVNAGAAASRWSGARCNKSPPAEQGAATPRSVRALPPGSEPRPPAAGGAKPDTYL